MAWAATASLKHRCDSERIWAIKGTTLQRPLRFSLNLYLTLWAGNSTSYKGETAPLPLAALSGLQRTPAGRNLTRCRASCFVVTVRKTKSNACSHLSTALQGLAPWLMKAARPAKCSQCSAESFRLHPLHNKHQTSGDASLK